MKSWPPDIDSLRFTDATSSSWPTRNKTLLETRASLLVAKGTATRNKELLETRASLLVKGSLECKTSVLDFQQL